MKRKLFFLAFIISTNCIVFAQNAAIKIEGIAQGTTYHITYFDSKNRNFSKAIEKILADFDKSVSTYVPNSIISKINANVKKVKADKYFIACFLKAKEIYKNTGGVFDPTVYSLVNIWGFGQGKKEKAEQQKIDSILAFTGFNLVELNNRQVIKKDPRVKLDFNAFAQGYSVDVVAHFLDSKKITSYLVEIGGEVYAKGRKPDGKNWTVGIEKPDDNTVTKNAIKAIAKLENLSLATSGNYRKFFIENGIRYAHHIDPFTGYPAKNNLLSASVFSADCISADANATGILVMGLDKAKLFLSVHPELQAYLIYFDEKGNYQTYQTPGIEAIISPAEE